MRVLRMKLAWITNIRTSQWSLLINAKFKEWAIKYD